MKMASCHPDRKHHCKGMCASCYSTFIRAKNKELRNATDRKRRANNPGVEAKKRKMKRLEKLEQAREIDKIWRHSNPERIRQYTRNYRKNHPEKNTAFVHNRRSAIIANGGKYTAEEFINLCNRYGNKCLRCGAKTKLTVDHVIPLSIGGTNSIDNIQPLCASCNSRKHKKIEDYRTVTEPRRGDDVQNRK